ncbi:MAG: methionine/alanine import family NSS transporter small subunit [Gemmatimonadota bacterium]
MTATTIIVMVLILGFVWGGLIVIMLTALRKEREKGPGEALES